MDELSTSDFCCSSEKYSDTDIASPKSLTPTSTPKLSVPTISPPYESGESGSVFVDLTTTPNKSSRLVRAKLRVLYVVNGWLYVCLYVLTKRFKSPR